MTDRPHPSWLCSDCRLEGTGTCGEVVPCWQGTTLPLDTDLDAPIVCKRGSGFACDGPVCGERYAEDVPVGQYRHPCGHDDVVRGCGGCDPGAIELQVLDDGTVLREGDPGWHDVHSPFTRVYPQGGDNPVDKLGTGDCPCGPPPVVPTDP